MMDLGNGKSPPRDEPRPRAGRTDSGSVLELVIGGFFDLLELLSHFLH